MEQLSIRNTPIIHHVVVTDCPPEWSWDDDRKKSNFYNLWVVLRGRGTLRSGDKTTELSPGTAILLMPFAEAHGRHDRRCPLYVIAAHFSIPDGMLGSSDTGQPFLKRKYRNVGLLRDLLRHIAQLYFSGQNKYAELYLSAVLAELFPNGKEEAGLETPVRNEIIDQICDELQTDIAHAPSLREFADRFGYSQDHLGRLFRTSVGIPFSQYVINARVNNAKFLLRESDLSLSEIAEQLGWYDCAYFFRQFKQAAGLTPGQYRRAFR